MCDSAWSVDRFGVELTAVLITVLEGTRDAAALSQAVTKCAAAAEEACSDRPMACAAGCPHCCVLNVAILLPECMVIADSLLEQLSSSALGALRARLAAHSRFVRWMDDEERITKKTACPMLDAAGHCTIHPVRPLVCRAVASFDRYSCQEAFSPVITHEPRLVQADMLRQMVFDTAFRHWAKPCGNMVSTTVVSNWVAACWLSWKILIYGNICSAEAGFPANFGCRYTLHLFA